MGTIGSKLGNAGLNAILGLLAVGALILIWALVAQSRSGERSTVDPVRTSDRDIIQVEVRNGCGVTGLAAEMTSFLRSEGFDVVEAGDHDNFSEPETFILDRSGNPGAALAVARALGLPEDRVREAIKADLYLDASLVIGLDYESILPFQLTQ